MRDRQGFGEVMVEVEVEEVVHRGVNQGKVWFCGLELQGEIR